MMKFIQCVLKSGVLVPFIFFILMVSTFPIDNLSEFDPDEGTNLMRAYLYGKGYEFYSEIWTDHPPLFPIILSWWFQVFGTNIISARILVLIFSSIFLWMLYMIMRRSSSLPATIAGLLFLVISFRFIRLSASVMIAIPDLSCLMISIYLMLLSLNNKHRTLFILSSGIAMTLSLQIKLFSAVIIPVMAGYLIFDFLAKTFGPKTIS